MRNLLRSWRAFRRLVVALFIVLTSMNQNWKKKLKMSSYWFKLRWSFFRDYKLILHQNHDFLLFPTAFIHTWLCFWFKCDVYWLLLSSFFSIIGGSSSLKNHSWKTCWHLRSTSESFLSSWKLFQDHWWHSHWLSVSFLFNRLLIAKHFNWQLNFDQPELLFNLLRKYFTFKIFKIPIGVSNVFIKFQPIFHRYVEFDHSLRVQFPGIKFSK